MAIRPAPPTRLGIDGSDRCPGALRSWRSRGAARLRFARERGRSSAGGVRAEQERRSGLGQADHRLLGPPVAQQPDERRSRDHARDRAFANEGKGDHDRAIADYDEAIRLEPNNASAYAARGRVFEKKGDPRRALADFNKALTLQSDLSGAIAGRDRMRAALAAVPGPETPAAAPTPVAAAPPASQAPSVVLGNGDLDRALSSVEETIRLDPKNASAYAKRGRVFEKKGDPAGPWRISIRR